MRVSAEVSNRFFNIVARHHPTADDAHALIDRVARASLQCAVIVELGAVARAVQRPGLAKGLRPRG